MNSSEQQQIDGEISAQRRRMDGFSIADRMAADRITADDTDVFVATGAGVVLDFKKHLLDQTCFELLLRKARACELEQQRAALFAGATVNTTEQRAALHTLLRTPAGAVPLSLRPLHHDVLAVQQRMRDIAHRIRNGQWPGFSGKPISAIVNIGIGGSDLGPRMAYRALAPLGNDVLPCHFVSNVDPESISTTLRRLDPATTLFIVASKSFTTPETLQNALTARQWLLDHGASADTIARHFIAISARTDRAVDFGMGADNVLPMWDWVGGRFSLWSAIGLAVAIALGFDQFEALLAGAHAMDQHFQHTALVQNLPVILALLEHWYVGHWHCRSHAILPYAEQLELLPAYLQQLTMESLGKHTRLDGTAINGDTCPVIWGTAGTNGQHSYYQLLHQGTPFVSCDFIVPLRSAFAPAEQHLLLVANAFAQSRVLMTGQSAGQAALQMRARGATVQEANTLAPHKVMPGNRPSSTLLVDQIDAHTLGALLALYEHKVYCASVLWNINAFDQWGVELGKEAGLAIANALRGDDVAGLDASTRLLVARFRRRENQPG